MNEANTPHQEQDDGQNAPHRGPNLILVYGLIFLAMIVAVVIAVMVVLPFYHRR